MYWRDKLGYDFEGQFLQAIPSKLKRYLTWHNPRDPKLWKATRGHGVDFKFQIAGLTVHIDCSYQSGDYNYHRKWFLRDKLPRFNDSANAQQFIVASRPESFSSIHHLTKQYNITVHSIQSIIAYLLSTIPHRHNIETVYALGHFKVKYKIISEVEWGKGLIVGSKRDG
jgi:hypothetical protein